MLARPWKTIPREGSTAQVAATLAREAAALAADADGLAVVVIGLPRRLSGEPNEQTGHVEALMARLATLITVPLVAQDERLTSLEAESLLARREKDWRKRKHQLDATAASVILQDYLDGLAKASPGEVEGEEM